MKAFFLVLILIVGLLIIVNKDYKRLIIFFLAIVFIPASIQYPTSGLSSHRFFILAYLVSLICHRELNKIYRMPCLLFLFLVAVSYLGTGLNDHRLSLFTQIWRPFIYFCIEYGLLVMGFCSTMKSTDWNKFEKIIFRVALIINIYGIITYVLKIDPWGFILDKQLQLSEFAYDYSIDSLTRCRICSFLINSHLYGYFNALLCLYFTYLMYKQKLSRNEKVVFLITVIGVLLSGSRSSFMMAILGVAMLSLFGLKIKKTARYGLIGLFLLLPLSQMEIFQSKFASLNDAFKEEGGNTGGSSIEMRENQKELSLLLFAQSPVWGNGFDYFGENISGDEYWEKEGINGAESYYFILLIERGGIEMLTISVFVVMLSVYLYRNRRKIKLEYSFALAMFLSFFIISFMTGNRGKWEYCFLFLGLLLDRNNVSALSMKKQQNDEG